VLGVSCATPKCLSHAVVSVFHICVQLSRAVVIEQLNLLETTTNVNATEGTGRKQLNLLEATTDVNATE
jgi:hypothetical protein